MRRSNVAPRASANRVTYAHAQLSEWYVNGPLGLEQGFTIARPPAPGPAPASTTLSMAVTGNAHVALSPGSQSIVLSRARGRAGAPSLRYYDLTATDASGRTLHSWLALHGDTVVLHLDTAGARYPLTVDPLIALSEQLTGAEEQGPGRFGWSVALSADGDTALVGAPRDDDDAGAVWVFVRSGSSWVQQGPKLTGEPSPGGAGDEQCAEEEVDEEAKRMRLWHERRALGQRQHRADRRSRAGTNAKGAAWVFRRSGSTWSEHGEMLTGGSEERGDGRFGRAVALSSNGDIALIGAPGDAGYHGAAWIFTGSESGWSQPGQKLTATGETGAGHFGHSVALSADGYTAVIGAPANQKYVGAAWSFSRSGSSWGQEEELTGGAGEVGSGSLWWQGRAVG